MKSAEETLQKHLNENGAIIGKMYVGYLHKAMEEYAEIFFKEFLVFKYEHYYEIKGKYRHVGDFYRNDKLKTLEQIFTEFKQYIKTNG